MPAWRFALATLAIFTALAGCKPSDPPRPPSAVEPPGGEPAAGGLETAVADGRALYLRHCGACHGEQGDGAGFAAAYLFPKPRDLQAGKFRLVSSHNRLARREDLLAVLRRGMPGSTMPSWSHLTDPELAALTDEVMRLWSEGARMEFEAILRDQEGLSDEELADPAVQAEVAEIVRGKTTADAALPIPEPPEETDEAIARGRALYVRQSCHSCHGLEGRGDGTQVMLDDEGLPLRPRDLTRGIFKGGDDLESVYLRIALGMPGTPMPSSQQLTTEELFDLTHFIRSLSDDAARRAVVMERRRLITHRVEKVDPRPDSSWWQGISAVPVGMIPLWWRDDADPHLQVQASHDGQVIALRLTWNDETPNLHDAAGDAFADAAAIQLFRGEQEPFLGMGATDAPLDVWFWDADRQGAPVELADLHPRITVDQYPFSEATVATAEYERPGTARGNQPEISLPAEAAKNPILPPGGESGASSLTVGGPGTVTFRPPLSRLVEGRGVWREGRWSVVLQRALAVEEPGGGVPLTPGVPASIGFALWEGSRRDRDGQKLISIWHDLHWEERAP